MLKIVKRLTLFLAAYITYALVLNLSVFDAQPSELVLSYQQGEALSAEHYRLLGLEYLDRDAEQAGKERLARWEAWDGDRMPDPDNEHIGGLSTGIEGRGIPTSSTDLSELKRIAAMDENGEIFDSMAWQELNRRLANTDWQALGSSSLDAKSYYNFVINAITPIHFRYWQLVYIIRNEDEFALAAWLAQQMELVEYPNSLLDISLASAFRTDFIRELLNLEFLSTAMRRDLTSQINRFIGRVEGSREAIWTVARQREAQDGVGATFFYISVGWTGPTEERMGVVFSQSQRFENQMVDALVKRTTGATYSPRPLLSKILWPQHIVGDLELDSLFRNPRNFPGLQRHEQNWNTYVDSLVEFRTELAQLQ